MVHRAKLARMRVIQRRLGGNQRAPVFTNDGREAFQHESRHARNDHSDGRKHSVTISGASSLTNTERRATNACGFSSGVCLAASLYSGSLASILRLVRG